MDTSALISLATVNILNTFLQEFEIHITEEVVEELEETSGYDDIHGKAARNVLENLEKMTIHEVKGKLESSRIDKGEGSCALLTRKLDAKFLITDDMEALPELKEITDSKVAISPIVLKSLVKRDSLEREEALEKLKELGEQRSWLEAPIFRRAQELFEKD